MLDYLLEEITGNGLNREEEGCIVKEIKKSRIKSMICLEKQKIKFMYFSGKHMTYSNLFQMRNKLGY